MSAASPGWRWLTVAVPVHPARKVLAFLSQAYVEPDLTIEIFLIDAPLKGFGAFGITEEVLP